MNRIFSIAAGIVLCLFGLLMLGLNLVGPLFWPSLVLVQVWQLWPLLVLGMGAAMCLGGLGALQRPGLGGLFIPGVPLLVTGGILTAASLSGHWEIWAWAWPFELLGLAAGFIVAAIAMRLVWLVIPAILIGLNGLALSFTAMTGMWNAWAVLWAVEPLAIGLILLLVAYKSRSPVVGIVGGAFCAFALFAFSGMSLVLLAGPWLLRIIGPALLMLAGLALLALAFLRRPARLG